MIVIYDKVRSYATNYILLQKPGVKTVFNSEVTVKAVAGEVCIDKSIR